MAFDYPYALSAQRYREVLAADYTRLRGLTEQAGTAPVVECPGWTAADAAHHTAAVYQDKVTCIQTGRQAPEFPHPDLVPLSAGQALDRCWAALSAELDRHDPDDPAYTWWPPDQTVGFWVRRMAHETSIHRRDLESALDQRSPVAEDLAVDGIDEVLELFLSGDWEDEAVAAASGRAVAVDSAGHRWVVTLNPRIVELDRTGGTPAAATVSGEPSEVLLWLWGRGPRPRVAGEQDAVTELRERLVLATQ